MRTVRTPKKREAFLSSLRAEAGNVSRACQCAGISRRAAYEWRDADAQFAEAWDDIIEETTEVLEREVYRRAHEGVDEPVFYQGEMVGAVRKYSDTLAMFILKGRRPEKYRENIKQEISGEVEHTHRVVRVPPKAAKEEWPEILELKP